LDVKALIQSHFGSLHVKKDRQKKQNEKQGCCCRDQINKRKSLA
jgi:hypothetical protein